MKYQFNNSNFNNFDIFEDNKLPARAYFIPFKNKKLCDTTTFLNERYLSENITILNGEWDFKYYKSVNELPQSFDTSATNFDKVKVPSCWQYTGYEEPYYVNAKYQFPKKTMPLIPNNSPVAVYRKNIIIATCGKRVLTFLGVCSNIELYINGKYVGYSEGSHNSAEFDITKFVTEGNNEIVALVYKYCNGTYLECQDMFRSNGIFRDVYITTLSDVSVFDFSVKTLKANNDYDLVLSSVANGKAKVNYMLYFDNQLISSVSSTTNEEISVRIKNVKEWSAEIPNLYTLYLEVELEGKVIECIRQEVSFRNIVIKDSIYYFNNQAIKIKGVNRHDSHESNGYVLSIDDHIKDITLMKKLNVNTCRTSHYPPDPIFLKLCNHYGLYVIDEADIETHGCCTEFPSQEHKISNDLNWANHYIDRVLRMYERDKNNNCIMLWSLGNEAGGYKCQEACYHKIREKSLLTPVHYEGVVRTPKYHFDVFSMMYSSTEFMEAYLKKDKKVLGKYFDTIYNVPFILCEYAHAMGLGPGNLSEYMDLFYQSDTIMGGCIWEWLDHAVLHKNDKYKFKYTYGGDHGEEKHDSNFCVDGLILPNREPSTSAYNMQNAYRPILAKLSGDKLSLTNTNRFRISDYISIKYSQIINGKVVSTNKITDIIPCKKTITVNIDLQKTKDDSYILITYTDKISNEFIAQECLTVNDVVAKLDAKQSLSIINNTELTFKNGTAKFDDKTGFLVSYKINDKELINQSPCNDNSYKGFVPSIYKPVIDNYMYYDKVCKRMGITNFTIALDSFNVVDNTIIVTQSFITSRKKIKLQAKTTYKPYNDGSIDITCELLNTSFLFSKKFDLPKFGLVAELNKEFSNIEYYGLGEKENYPDFNNHSVMGIYKSTASKMYEHSYIKPQDNGNRGKIRWSSITNADGIGIKIEAIDKAINIKFNHTTYDMVSKAKHQEDIKELNTTTLSVDGFIRGVGSNSCGPDTRAEYKIFLSKKEKLTYAFRLSPIIKL